MSLNVQLLRDSFFMVVEREPQVVVRFYEILFERYPMLKPMFSRNAPEAQQRMLQQALIGVIENLENPQWLAETLQGLGLRHVDYGVTEEMYAWVGECLLATLAEVAGEAWSPELEQAWTDAYGAIASLMLEGAKAAA